jgi:hypothetical protein
LAVNELATAEIARCQGQARKITLDKNHVAEVLEWFKNDFLTTLHCQSVLHPVKYWFFEFNFAALFHFKPFISSDGIILRNVVVRHLSAHPLKGLRSCTT